MRVLFRVGGHVFRSFFVPRATEPADLPPRFDGEIVEATRSYQPGGALAAMWDTLLLDPEFEIP